MAESPIYCTQNASPDRILGASMPAVCSLATQLEFGVGGAISGLGWVGLAAAAGGPRSTS